MDSNLKETKMITLTCIANVFAVGTYRAAIELNGREVYCSQFAFATQDDAIAYSRSVYEGKVSGYKF
jgi:hypothetical protein